MSTMPGIVFALLLLAVLAAGDLAFASQSPQPESHEILRTDSRTRLDKVLKRIGPLDVRAQTAADENEARRGKIGSDLALHLRKLIAEHRLSETASVVILIQGELSSSLRAQLEGLGLTIRGVVGNVVSGDIRAAELETLSKIDEVRLIELPEKFHVNPPRLEPGRSE